MLDLTEYYPVLKNCILFSSLSRERIQAAVELMHGKLGKYEKGEILHQARSPLPYFGLVLQGAVRACCDDTEGNRIIMAEVQAGITFGESLSYLKISDSPVYIDASEKATVLWLSAEAVFDDPSSREKRELGNRFTALLASRTLSMNDRIQILSKYTIREKLTVYFSQLAEKNRSDTFRIPLTREDLADYIGTNRSALSREISRMKKEGLLEENGNMLRFIRRGNTC